MIAIRFKPCFEDRVNIYLKQSRIKKLQIEYSFEETPSVFGDENRLAYWILKPRHNRQINIILSELKNVKSIMGVEDLQFQYVNSMKEYYNQFADDNIINWFDI